MPFSKLFEVPQQFQYSLYLRFLPTLNNQNFRNWFFRYAATNLPLKGSY